MMQKTFIPEASKIEKKFYVLDAKDQILGKVATKAATLLRGKHKTCYTPHLETGDHVIIINAKHVRVTGNKLQDKIYQRYSGYPSGQKVITLEAFLKKAPAKVVQLAVNRMIPKGPLGNKVRTRLRVYAGDSHPHQAQKPTPIAV